MRNAIVASLVVFAAFSQAPAQAAPTDKEIKDTFSALDTAWNKRDMKSYAEFYEEDAVIMMFTGALFEGRDTLLKQAEAAKPTKRKTTVDRVSFVKPEVALVDAVMEISPADSKDTLPVKVRMVVLQLKKSEKWKILEVRTYPIAEAPAPAKP